MRRRFRKNGQYSKDRAKHSSVVAVLVNKQTHFHNFASASFSFKRKNKCLSRRSCKQATDIMDLPQNLQGLADICNAEHVTVKPPQCEYIRKHQGT